jgi:hypothetical protein
MKTNMKIKKVINRIWNYLELIEQEKIKAMVHSGRAIF